MLFGGGFWLLDRLFPLDLPDPRRDFAVVVTAEDGTPLRGFPDPNGVWRYPAKTESVSPLYLQALIQYEDRFYAYHPGVNPWSLCRGLFQYIRSGRPQTGGSTLTMQVARLFHPHSKTIPGKLYQIFRALQLELYFTKKEILTFYLNYAPFGGPIQGVRAASHAYLGKSPQVLSHAQAALLAVLPQAPSRLRPDRHPGRAARARDKVLDRLEKFGVWDPQTVAGAKLEQVRPRFAPRPMMAPLLARELKTRHPRAALIRTTLLPDLQQTLSALVENYIQNTPARTSAAAIVVENKSLKVRAYRGSADFGDRSRFGYVDMIQAYRSPGSTLKPFLYGFALEEGLIHSESLLVDAPFSFGSYRPENFSANFSGPVSAARALQRSLNIPAVDLLDRLEPRFFDARLRQGGLLLRYPSGSGPNLSLILGGVGVRLCDLVAAYTALAREGLSGRLRYLVDDRLKERRMFTPGAAYIIRRILMDQDRPDLPAGRLYLDRSRQVAWKTGTSYGFRDAWTIGVTDRYTVGVWVGRPDGTPSPGQYGRATAAPLLLGIVDSLPRGYSQPDPIPESVGRAKICWPLGKPPRFSDDPLCYEQRTAWILNGQVPPTFPDRTDDRWQANPITVWLAPDTGLRVELDCPVPDPVRKAIARWPRAARPWLSPGQRRMGRIPPLDPRCQSPASAQGESIRIMGLADHTVVRPPGSRTELPAITLWAQGGEGGLYWLLDGALIARADIGQARQYQFKSPGRYQLTVMDLAGNYDSVELRVMGGRGRAGS